MPKLKCPCGFVHDLSPIPDDGWRTVRDRDHEQMLDDQLAAAQGDKAAMNREIGACGLLYECLECHRVMWQKPGAEQFVVYRPDDSPTDIDSLP